MVCCKIFYKTRFYSCFLSRLSAYGEKFLHDKRFTMRKNHYLYCFAAFLVSITPFFQAAGDDQPDFKEEEERHGEQGLRNDVRRGKEHTDHKGGKNDVGALVGQGFCADDTEHDEDDGGNRRFKYDAERKEHADADRHVVGDVRHEGYACSS